MSMTAPSDAAAAMPLSGHYLPEVHALAKRGILWAVLYALFARGTTGGCLTPMPEVEPWASVGVTTVCYNAALGPSPLVWLALALVFVASVGRLNRATTTEVAGRILSRAARAMWIIPVLAIVLGAVWFFSVSPETWLNGAPPWVSVEITPQT